MFFPFGIGRSMCEFHFLFFTPPIMENNLTALNGFLITCWVVIVTFLWPRCTFYSFQWLCNSTGLGLSKRMVEKAHHIQMPLNIEWDNVFISITYQCFISNFQFLTNIFAGSNHFRYFFCEGRFFRSWNYESMSCLASAYPPVMRLACLTCLTWWVFSCSPQSRDFRLLALCLVTTRLGLHSSLPSFVILIESNVAVELCVFQWVVARMFLISKDLPSLLFGYSFN